MFSDTDDILSMAFNASRDAVCRHLHVREGAIGRDAVLSTLGASPRPVILARQVLMILLRDTFGCSFGEIARKTGISGRRVMSNVSNARWAVRNDPLCADIHDTAKSVLNDYGKRTE